MRACWRRPLNGIKIDTDWHLNDQHVNNRGTPVGAAVADGDQLSNEHNNKLERCFVVKLVTVRRTSPPHDHFVAKALLFVFHTTDTTNPPLLRTVVLDRPTKQDTKERHAEDGSLLPLLFPHIPI